MEIIQRIAYFVDSRTIGLGYGRLAEQRLYRLDPAYLRTSHEDDEPTIVDHVIVSATDVPGSGEETYIFPADKHGEIIKHIEMSGSFRGGLDHDAALAGLGYEVVTEAAGGTLPGSPITYGPITRDEYDAGCRIEALMQALGLSER